MTQRKDQAARGQMTRREVLRRGATAAAGAAVGPFVITPARAQSFNWQRFKGKELFLIFFKHPWAEEIVKYAPEFESLTGIKVKYEILPEIQARQKLTVEMTAASGGLDAFLSSLHVEKRRFWKAGWYEPLNKYLEDKTLTAPDYDWNDFTATAKAAVTQPDKTVSALPSFVDPDILFYRKDIFQEKGLKPPKTLEEMESLAQKLHNPKNNMYGFVARGLKNANASPFAYIVFAMGAEYLTPDRKSALNTPAWVKGLEYYSGMLRQFAPPGVVNFNWYECSAAFMQGQVAMYYDGVNFRHPVRRQRRNPRSRARWATPSCRPARAACTPACSPAGCRSAPRAGTKRRPGSSSSGPPTSRIACANWWRASAAVGPRPGTSPRSRRSRGCRPTGTPRSWRV